MATTFQRARSDEQRAVRSQAILDTAAAMLQEMPVADISLNELSRRVGLAKSNVLRYFDSREAVLLELLRSSSREWLAHLAAEVPSAVRRRARFNRRAEQLATAIARSLVERPVLCDLMSAQAAVLEHNVSVEAVTKYKLAAVADAEVFAGLVRDALPELSHDEAWRYMVGAWVMTQALWAHARPPEAVLQALAADERLEATHLDFPVALEDYLTTLAVGLHARAAGLGPLPDRRAVRFDGPVGRWLALPGAVCSSRGYRGGPPAAKKGGSPSRDRPLSRTSRRQSRRHRRRPRRRLRRRSARAFRVRATLLSRRS